MPTIRVFIIADVRFYREGLAERLAGDDRFAVVGAVAGTDEPETVVDSLRPDVVLLDTGLPDGVELVTRLTQLQHPVKVVVLAVHETDSSVLAWAEAGASAYVPRDATFEQLAQVIEGSARGELHCSPHIAGSLLRRVAALAASLPRGNDTWFQLTQRERDILRLIGRGLSNKQIAHSLGIELATAKNHVHHIFEKLQVHRRTDAMLWVRSRPLGRDLERH